LIGIKVKLSDGYYPLDINTKLDKSKQKVLLYQSKGYKEERYLPPIAHILSPRNKYQVMLVGV